MASATVLHRDRVVDMFEFALKKRVKKTGEIAMTFSQQHREFALINRDEMNIQMKAWRTQQKNGLLKIKRYNSKTAEYDGRKYYFFVVQPYKNGKMTRCNFDPMGLFLFGEMVDGYMYAFVKEENRDAVEKYVMGGKYDEEDEVDEDDDDDDDDDMMNKL